MTRFITLEQALRLHKASIDRFGGSHGLRDQGALESALAMPESGFGGVYLHDSIYDKASAYLYHIVKNHPFIDGNKRTGLGCTEVFLYGNGYCIRKEHEQDMVDLVLRTASEPIAKNEISRLLEEYSDCIK